MNLSLERVAFEGRDFMTVQVGYSVVLGKPLSNLHCHLCRYSGQ